MGEILPIELVFNPRWWQATAGISFDCSFYLDSTQRIQNDLIMRRILYERYGSLGLGEPNPQPRPVVGSPFVAGGFIVPALLGAEIHFTTDAAPQPVGIRPGLDPLERLEQLDFLTTWPLSELIAQMDSLGQEYGYLIGDFDLDGVLNTAYHVHGQSLFTDIYYQSTRLMRYFELLGKRMVEIARYMRRRTGTCSIATNRMVGHVEPEMFLHSNCSVTMISPKSYQQMLLPVETWMAEELGRYGIHHCGDRMQAYAAAYARTTASFYDLGWGSDVALCRKQLPEAFFSLRLSPARMLQCTPEEIAHDTEQLLLAAGPLDQAGVCCINMDAGTPDENIFAMASVVERFRGHRGA